MRLWPFARASIPATFRPITPGRGPFPTSTTWFFSVPADHHPILRSHVPWSMYLPVGGTRPGRTRVVWSIRCRALDPFRYQPLAAPFVPSGSRVCDVGGSMYCTIGEFGVGARKVPRYSSSNPVPDIVAPARLHTEASVLHLAAPFIPAGEEWGAWKWRMGRILLLNSNPNPNPRHIQAPCNVILDRLDPDNHRQRCESRIPGSMVQTPPLCPRHLHIGP